MPRDNAKASDVWVRYQYVRDNGHLDYVRKARQCEDFFSGLQWNPEDLSLLRAQRRPALTINKIISTISNVLGEQIFNRTEVAFRPRNGPATEEIATVLQKVFMQISDNNQLPWVRSDVFADGVITSRGFYDVRLDFSDSLRGEVRVEQLNPKNVLIDPDGEEYDPDKWGDVLVTKWMSPDQIALLYSEADAEELKGRQESFFPYGYDSIDRDRDRFGTPRAVTYGMGPESSRGTVRNLRVIERQWKKLDMRQHFVDIATGDMRLVPPEWDRNRIAFHLQQNPHLTVIKKLVPRIRWTVIAENYVLHDDWSPYKHFTVVPYFPYFRRGRTVGLVENLLGPQELLNKVSSQELHVVNTSANSGWKLKANSLKNMSVAELEQRGAQTGLVIELDDVGNAEKIQPNQVPSGLDRISFKAEEHIKTISGISDYRTGSAREDVSAKAVKYNQQAGSANTAKVMDNLQRTDFILARNVLDLVQEFYSEERMLHITTDRITGASEQLVVNQMTPEGTVLNDLTLGEYGIVITNMPERDTMEDTQFEQAVMLRTEAGVQIPDRFIIESSRLKNKNDIIKALEGDKDSPEAQAEAQRMERSKEAEVQKLEAEALQKKTDADLKAAKAKLELAKAATEEGAGGQAEMEYEAEMQKLDAEMQLEWERMERKFELEAAQMRQKMELERQKMQQELAIKKEMAESEALQKRALAAHQASLMESESKTRMAQQQEQGKAQDKEGKEKAAPVSVNVNVPTSSKKRRMKFTKSDDGSLVGEEYEDDNEADSKAKDKAPE